MKEETALALRETILLPADIEEMAFRELLDKKAHEIKQLLPPDRNIDRFIKQTMIAVSRKPDLAQCTKKSLFLATVDCAELDLDFTPAKGWAYLVPYKGEASFMPGYRGFIELATRNGRVSNVESIRVHEKDEFEIIRGTHPEIIHKQSLDANRGNVIGCYALAWFNNSRFQAEWMAIDEIKEIQRRAKTQYVWKSDEGEMQRKTVVRRLFKYLPTSPEITRAMEHDNNQFLSPGETNDQPDLNEAMNASIRAMEADQAETVEADVVTVDDVELPEDELQEKLKF